MRTLPRTWQACSTVALYSAITLTAAQSVVFQTSVAPQPDEDMAAPCRYEITLTNPSRPVQGVWVIFERSRDMLPYYTLSPQQ